MKDDIATELEWAIGMIRDVAPDSRSEVDKIALKAFLMLKALREHTSQE